VQKKLGSSGEGLNLSLAATKKDFRNERRKNSLHEDTQLK